MDRYQKQRYELKYRIPSRLMEPLRHFVACHLQIDPYCGESPDLAYPVHSLYLDSRDMRLYQATINGDRNRHKLRVRYYTPDPQSPVFCEVKSRRNDVIHKCRAMVRRSFLNDLLNGRPPAASDLHSDDSDQLGALLRFCDLRCRLSAAPKTHVGYLREAWLAADNSVRVTMDQQVGTRPVLNANLCTDLAGLTSVFGKQVVLEIKFTDRYPHWLAELVRVFGLRQGSAAKYVDGVVALGEHLFLAAPARNEVRRHLAMRQAG